MQSVIIDVRERDEFDAEHIEKSIHIPLSEFPQRSPGILTQLEGKKVTIMCRSGNRAKLAEDQIKKLGFYQPASYEIYPGGILAWKKEGKPTLAHKKGHLPIIRQVHLIAGLLVLVSSVAAALFFPPLLWVSAFVGAGLTVAGATGFCGMAIILSKMPWNKTNPNRKEELCSVSPKSSSCSR
jgi:rhodanese-related sulfurtransferase